MEPIGKEEDEIEVTFEQALVYAARHGDMDEVQEMVAVRSPPVDVNYMDEGMSKNTALHVSAANGHADIVKVLL